MFTTSWKLFVRLGVAVALTIAAAPLAVDRPEGHGAVLADPYYCVTLTDPEGRPVQRICIPAPVVAEAA